jgi:hypothetical protein
VNVDRCGPILGRGTAAPGSEDVLHETTVPQGKGRQRRAVGRIATTSPARYQTIAELLESLGDVSATRVRVHPFPGTATERDVITVQDRENLLCELVDGVLVEKVTGFDESRFAVLLGAYFVNFA